MKKLSIMIFLLGTVFLYGCDNAAPTTPSDNNGPAVAENDELIPYKTEMKQPDFNEMENKDEIQQEEYKKRMD